MTTPEDQNNGSIGSTASSLLVRVQDRDPQAWLRLADQYGPLVYHWCRSFGLSPEDAADVFQEVFSAVAKSVNRFLAGQNGSNFRGWLWTITRNKVRDQHRLKTQHVAATGGTHAQLRLAEVPETLDDSIDAAHSSETANLFHRALEMVRCEFEPHTWQAFWRAAVDGDATSEIASDLGMTANSVRQAKSRVLRRLRRELGDIKDED